MKRNFSCRALALRVRASGESNREAWFFSAEEGLFRATVFGGPKSRLRSRVAPFHEGMLWVYHDPVRDSRKATDFDVQQYRQGLRELYERAMAANAVAETILSSHGGGGNWGEAMALSSGVLDALENSTEAACPPLAVYFLWHWARILGIKPDIADCGSESGAAWYSPREETFINAGRSGGDAGVYAEDRAEGHAGGHYLPRNSLLRVSPGARRWLAEIESLPPSAITVPGEASSLEDAAALAKAVLAAALGRSLPTWENV